MYISLEGLALSQKIFLVVIFLIISLSVSFCAALMGKAMFSPTDEKEIKRILGKENLEDEKIRKGDEEDGRNGNRNRLFC